MIPLRLVASSLTALTFLIGSAPAAAPAVPKYEYRRIHDPDGIGKFYMGREIAQVMGHLAADWLDRPEREKEEQPRKLLEALPLRPGDVVADLGAGSGYYTFRLADPRQPGASQPVRVLLAEAAIQKAATAR